MRYGILGSVCRGTVRSGVGVASLALALAAPAFLNAQSFTASVRGMVTDSSQAAVPAVKVTVTDVNRNLDFTGQADAAGRYIILGLPPGTYKLSAEASGFQKYSHSAFALEVQQQATIDVELRVGQISTSVEVEGTAPLLDATSATLGQVIQNRYIQELPLMARNPYTLAYLTPGIVGASGAAPGTNGSAGGATNFSAVGTRTSTADVMLDGVSVTGAEQNSGITAVLHTPSVEAVQEFKVQTSYFSAEFGNTGGAIINMVTKSGTNQFHGNGYAYFRDSVLNANSFFANRSGSPKAPANRKVYGGTIGGPVIKDKTFFFVSYERTPDGSAVTRLATFPTLQQRAGDFSDARTASGQQINIFNPFSLVNVNGNMVRTPFPGNVIPKSMMDPIALKAASYYPNPNQPGNANTFVNNWYGQGVDLTYNTQLEVKGDHNFTDKTRISMRWSPRWQTWDQADVFGTGVPGAPWSAKHGTVGGHKAMFEYTHIFSPTTIVNARWGLTTFQYFSVPVAGEFDLTKLGLPKYMYDVATNHVMPQFQPSGYNEIGDTGWVAQSQDQGGTQILASITKITHGHNLKIGGEYKWNYLDYSLPGYPSGSFSFSQQTTSYDRFAGSSTQGNGFASMLLGWGSGSRYDHVPWAMTRNNYYAGYVQDDWMVSRKLTVNLGVRYDLDRAAWEAQNRFSYWDLQDPSPLNGKVPGLGPLYGYFKFTDNNHPSSYPTPKNNWQPRVGIAYALNSKTTIRTAYGLFYTLSKASVRGSIGSGFSSQSSMDWSRDSNLTRYATLANPYPDGMNLPPGSSLGAMTFIGMGANTVVPENLKPYYHSWNFSIQRQLPGTAGVIEVNYTGTKGTHNYLPITSLSMLNPTYWSMGRNVLNGMVANPFYGVITDPRSSKSAATVSLASLLRAYPQYNGASRDEGVTGGNSIYNAVQFKYEKRLAQGFTALTHFTIAKSLENSGTPYNTLLGMASPFQDNFNLKNERALDNSDIPMRLIVTFSYQLPIGKGKAIGRSWGGVTNALLGGWKISSFMTFQSGVPLYVSQNGGTLWDATQRPNLVGDPVAPGSVVDRLNAYFNPAAFTQPATDALGSAPRALNYRAPGIRNADVSFGKDFAISERMRGEFRAETQNITNTPGFGFPGTAFGSTSFGVISGYGLGRGPRVVQLGAKFSF